MIIFEALEKALVSLGEIIEVVQITSKTDSHYPFLRDALIQRFEFTYELSWKTLKRFLKENYHSTEDSVKNIYRMAGKLGLINSVEKWFDYHQSRNLTTHTYNQDLAEQMIIPIKEFYQDATLLLNKMKNA